MNDNTIFHKDQVKWIGVRLLDINSNTFFHEGQYYKAILPTAQDYTKQNNYDSLLNELHAEGFIPKTTLTHLKMDGISRIYSQYTEYFNVSLAHANPLVLKEAALLYIKLNLWLYKRDLIISDGHTGNIVIQKQNAPYWCDIGSIFELKGHYELSGLEEFVRFFVYPLLLRSKCYSLGNMMRWGLVNGISHKSAVALNLLNKPLKLIGSREQVLKVLENLISSIEFPWEHTLWSDYNVQADIDTNIPDIVQGGHNRKAMVMRLLKLLAPKTVIDLGANSGSFSRLAASLGAEVLALEPDETAIARGHLHLREFNADNPIKFVTSGLFEMHKAADVAIALALTHHVFLTDKFPWNHIAKSLAEHTNKHLITEFMPNGLGMTQKQENLPSNYTLENFVEQLSPLFEKVEIIDYLHVENASPRILLLCTNKIHA